MNYLFKLVYTYQINITIIKTNQGRSYKNDAARYNKLDIIKPDLYICFNINLIIKTMAIDLQKVQAMIDALEEIKELSQDFEDSGFIKKEIYSSDDETLTVEDLDKLFTIINPE